MWLTLNNKRFKKKLDRISYSRTTILFLATLIIQLGLVEFFQLKLDARDAEVISILKFHNESHPDCVEKYFNTNGFSMLSKETFLFIYFQIFLLWLGYNAISNHHTDQAKVVASLNASGAFYGFVRVIEIKPIIDRYNANCGQYGKLDAAYPSNDVPNIVVTLMLACWLGYLTKLLSNELGGRIYQKIGSDKRMREMFKTRLTLIMLLKINMFYLAFMLIPVFTLFPIFFATLHMTVTLVALGMAYFAYRAIPKENVKTMRYFIMVWTFVIIDWIAIWILSFAFATSGSYFMLFFVSQYVFYGIMTVLYAVRVIKTFDKGMKEYVGQEIQNHKLETFVPIIRVVDYGITNLEMPPPVVIKS